MNCSELFACLVDKNAKSACAYTDKLSVESRECNRWYPYLDDFAMLVRNRAISILAANARWDSQNRYEALMDDFFPHITDEKPITARQCIQALPEIAAAKPALIPRMRAALEDANLTGYRDSMQPLILKDIVSALQKIAQQEKKI